ncbi:DnaJ -like protein subfamily C member 17 [Halotydeus destructor]|nr:DnaJ -like protein subfamily C member 17 [Halotydeus destructor]
MSEDITKIDLFEFLGVNENANDQEIKKAFRKQALTCHPDKHPDNPKAAELFQKYTKAAGILLDASARAAYEKVLRARKDRATRHKHLDSKRRKLRDDLEARERAAKDDVETEIDAAEKLAKEIERLRREGNKELEKQNEELQKQIEKEKREAKLSRRQPFSQSIVTEPHRVRAKWKKRAHDEDSLRKLFKHHGKISGLVISRKGTSAVIEYQSHQEAKDSLVLNADDLSVELIDSNATHSQPQAKLSVSENEKRPTFPSSASQSNITSSFSGFSTYTPSNDDFDAYEAHVLLKLKHAHERKLLAEQM